MKKYEKMDFQTGLCGTFALALHEYTKGKLALGMIRGERDEGDGEYVQVNVHAFCMIPGDEDTCLDSLTKQSISQLEEEWNMVQSLNEVEDYSCGFEGFENKEEFLKALKETGHTEITDEDYKAALNLIKKDKKLQKILKQHKLV